MAKQAELSPWKSRENAICRGHLIFFPLPSRETSQGRGPPRLHLTPRSATIRAPVLAESPDSPAVLFNSLLHR